MARKGTRLSTMHRARIRAGVMAWWDRRRRVFEGVPSLEGFDFRESEDFYKTADIAGDGDSE